MHTLKKNIYKIMAITSIKDTSTSHDMQIIGFSIVWNYILIFKSNK